MPTTHTQPNITAEERAKILAREVYINTMITALGNNVGAKVTVIDAQNTAIEAQMVALEATMAAANAGNVAATQAEVAAEIVLIRAALATQIGATGSAGITTAVTTGTHITILKTVLSSQFNPALV